MEDTQNPVAPAAATDAASAGNEPSPPDTPQTPANSADQTSTNSTAPEITTAENPPANPGSSDGEKGNGKTGLYVGIVVAVVVVLAIVACIVRRCRKGCSCGCSKGAASAKDGKMIEIYVGNISYAMTDDQLRKEFERFGVVKSARVIGHRASGKSKGFGFVEMPHAKEADIAIRNLNNREVMGRKLRVNVSRHPIPKA